MSLSLVHYVYLFIIVLIVITMCLKKDVILLCIIGSGLVGYLYKGNIVQAIAIMYKSVLVSGREFIEIIIIISLVSGMSKALKDAEADELMMAPLKKLMVNKIISFFILGIVMLFVSWFIWPTPAAAFVGSIMVPAAVSKGLSPVWCGVALNIFGNGMALSGDYFIQAAPSITGRTAGIKDPYEIIRASLIIWSVMSITVIIMVLLFMLKEKPSKELNNTSEELKDENTKIEVTRGSRIIAVLTPIAFLVDIIILYIYKLKGSDATAIIVGTAMLIMSLSSVIKFKFTEALARVALYVKEGFVSSIRIFAPIIIIGAFFYMGSKETASEILGKEAGGFLTDVGIFLAETVPLSKFSVVATQTSVSAMLGLGGSGFSGLPLIGTLAQIFEKSTNIDKASLAALGQVVTIWIGGGTVIPWRLTTIAAVCNVQSYEIAKRNLIPVLTGIVVVTIISTIIL